MLFLLHLEQSAGEEPATVALYSYTVNVRTVSKECAGAFRRALAPPGNEPVVGRCRVWGLVNHQW